MDKLKQWVVLTVVACVAIAAAGWFLAISPKRSEAAELRSQAAEQTAANQRLETQLQVLKAKAKDLPKEQAKLAAVAAKIPSDPALPSLVRSLLAAATSSGVELVSIAPGAPELVAVTEPVTAAAEPAQGQAAPEPGTGTKDSKATAAAPSKAGQLATIPLAIEVVGDYFEVQQFMSGIEVLPRALRVTTLTMEPGASPAATGDTSAAVDNGTSLLTTVNATVFMAANRPAATAAEVPAGAAAADTATSATGDQEQTS